MSVKSLYRILALLFRGCVYRRHDAAGRADLCGQTRRYEWFLDERHDAEQDGPGEKMPCKGMPPNCVTDIGCILLVSVPTPDLNLFTKTSWSSVIYDNASKRCADARSSRPRPSHLPRLNRSEPTLSARYCLARRIGF